MVKDPAKTFIFAFISIIIIVIAAVIILAYAGDEYIDDDGYQNATQFECTPLTREGDGCTAQYQPVCGFFDDDKVQCIKYPCAKTYGNNCEACHDDKVEYYIMGICPE